MEYKELVEHLKFGIGRASATGRLKFEYMNLALREMLQVPPKGSIDITLDAFFADKRRFNAFRKRIKEDGFVRKF